MRTRILMAAAIALLLGTAAQAQPAGQPAAAPAPEYGQPISNEQAKTAAAAAFAEAKKNNWRMVIVVVGPDGGLVYFEKMDGAQNASVALAQGKARTAVLYRRPSKAFADQYNAGNTAFLSYPAEARPIASEGGIPIVMNGKLIGAIGASGGSGQQDGITATAGANAVK